MTQKLAWAKEHGVEPPDFVRAAAEKEAQSAVNGPEPQHGCPHCHPSAQTPPGTAPLNRTIDGALKARTIVLIKALECQGLDSAGLLAALPAFLPTDVSFAQITPPLVETISFGTPLLPEVVLLIPAPPPRASR